MSDINKVDQLIEKRAKQAAAFAVNQLRGSIVRATGQTMEPSLKQEIVRRIDKTGNDAVTLIGAKDAVDVVFKHMYDMVQEVAIEEKTNEEMRSIRDMLEFMSQELGAGQ